MVERPKRSVIFVWHTAEERGLVGAYYFVQHCPVPVEKISANLNLDMITRNDPNSIYLIGSNKISSELDRSFHDMNAASVKLTLDYKYEDPGEPNRFFFRSDHYPYMRYGIPGVWIFCGTTPDYHQETRRRGEGRLREDGEGDPARVPRGDGHRQQARAAEARPPSGDHHARGAQHEGGLAAAAQGRDAALSRGAPAAISPPTRTPQSLQKMRPGRIFCMCGLPGR